MANAAGEPGPTTIIDSTNAENEDNRKLDAASLIGLPRVRVRFGSRTREVWAEDRCQRSAVVVQQAFDAGALHGRGLSFQV